MRVRRTGAWLAATGILAAVALWPATPASAHGAPISPVSRAFACRPESITVSGAACIAALAANLRAFGTWDNLRLPNIGGKDQQFVPDGQLCSGGLPEFRGLDLPRADWPSTAVRAATTLTIRYGTTIPHSGTFRVYLTKQGYAPTRALNWADLGEPIAAVTDPPIRNGAYTFQAFLPGDRAGRHVLYIVWQNSSTPDTYYSCSDVLVSAAGAGAGGARPTRPGAPPTPAAPATTVPGTPAPGAPPPRAPYAEVPPPPPTGAAGTGSESWLSRAEPVAERNDVGRQIMSAALVVLFGATGALGLLRLRAARNAEGFHRRPENR